MCGRFAQAIPVSTLKEFFDIHNIHSELPPSYNIAPSREIMTVTGEEKRILKKMIWGLIPVWARGKADNFNPLINARAETIHEKPAFSNSFKHKRCLIIADGFYEWKTRGKEKIPYFIRLTSSNPMALAGIYENYTSEEEGEILTCAIITTAADGSFAEIHNRMPVIIRKQNIDLWLSTYTEPKDLTRLFKPVSDNEIKYYRVSSAVNSPQNNSAELILPL